jgi:two-component system LytT family sensor kinase
MKQEETETAIQQNNNGNSIKWRKHEMILVAAIALISLAGYLWFLYHTPVNRYASAFINNHVAFNFYKNVLVPHIGMGLSVYLAYLWFSLYTIPKLLFPKEGKTLKKYAWAFIQAALIIFILGCVANIAIYYMHQWQFNYPGFSIFFDKNNPRSQLGLSANFFAVAASVFLFGLYIVAREIIISVLQASKQKRYNILVCNKVTGFIMVFLTVHTFLQAFDIIDEQRFFANYVLVFSALLATFISNVYWLFPMKGDGPFFNKKIIIRLLSTSFIYAIPLNIFVHEQGAVAFLYSWAALLFIATPLTWWYYQFNKDKILQLRIVEKELVQSKADLQFLRSQINPHFLFNTLNTLYGTALQENARRTAEGIQRLGDMMRFMLKENDLDLIPMDKEIEYLNNYISLQKLRTQSSKEIIIEDHINEQHCNHRIAPMLLIPLVENAFKHGISLVEPSWIITRLSCTEKEIIFEVRNSMHIKISSDPGKERSGIGFKNVVERLKLIYPGKHKILVNQDEKEFFVQISIEP